MEVSLVVSAWQLLGAAVFIASGFAVNTYMTNQNAKKLENLSDEHKTLSDKCNEMMHEETARNTFVTLELYKNEVNHLNKTMSDLKSAIDKILEYVRK